VKRVLDELHILGYPGLTLSGVDPDTEDFHDFRDLEIDVFCQHEAGLNGTFERWCLRIPKQQGLKDRSELDRLDRVLAGENGGAEKAPGAAADAVGIERSYEIDDSDVPF
jgi:hypothetical protein